MVTTVMTSLETALLAALDGWSVYQGLDATTIGARVCQICPNEEPEASDGYTIDGARRFVTASVDVYLYEEPDSQGISRLATAWEETKDALGPRLGQAILQSWAAADFELYEGDEDNPGIVLSGLKITANYRGTE